MMVHEKICFEVYAKITRTFVSNIILHRVVKSGQNFIKFTTELLEFT